MSMTQQEVIEALKALNPLPYKHWGSHVLNSYLFNPDKEGLLEQYVRTSGSCPISIEYISDIQVQKAIELGRKHGTDINLHTSPWQASAVAQTKSTERGVPYTTDLNNFTIRMSSAFLKINQMNFASATPVRVKAILIDVELWDIVDPANTPESLSENHRTIIQLCNAYFPNAKTIFYSRRAVERRNDAAGWSDPDDDGYFVGDEYQGTLESGDYQSFALYYPADIHMMQEAIRRNRAQAVAESFTKMIPFVALGGSGYLKNLSWHQWPQQVSGRPFAPTYPVVNSYLMGYMLNYHGTPTAQPDRFAPTDLVSEVAIWPAAGSPLVRNWWDHWVAYCQPQASNPNPLTVKEPYPEVFWGDY